MNQNVKLDKEKNCATTTIHSLSHDGRGIATINNKTTFISEALPNEVVAYKITQKHSRYDLAEATELLSTSSMRVTPPCQHFGVCGGCSLQHMSTESQVQLKQETLLQQLLHFGKVEPLELLPPLHVNSIGYRRKARLGVKFVIKKNKLLVGFREKSSRYLADLTRCEVLHPLIGENLEKLSDLIASLNLYRQIPQVEIAIGDITAALVFRHLEPLSLEDKEKLIAFGSLHHFHIYLQPNSPLPITKLYPASTPDRLHYTLPDYQLEFAFHPLDFTQINLEMNRLMVKQAVSLLDLNANDRVLDLFCGIGNFTLPIARHVNDVTGVEGSIDMIERAKENASHNNIHHARYYAADLTKPDSQAPWIRRTTYNKILLDPPRAGAKEILPFFAEFSAQKIVYISCNPSTLARDAGELVHQYGYRLKQAGIMNMFPHTSHIEAMAVFQKT